MLEQKFVQDGVHLTKESGKSFISTILRNVEASISTADVAAGLVGSPDLSKPPPTSFQFAADLLRKRDATESTESNTKKRKFDSPWADDSQMDEGLDGEAVTGGSVMISTKVLDSMLADIRANKDGVQKLNKGFENRKLEDNKSFAALREEADFNVNKSKQDRVVVFGLTSKTPLPASKPDRIKALKDLVMQQFLRIKPGYDGSINFISHLNFAGDRIPAVECRMNSVEKAIEIRKECGRVRKADKASQHVFVTNCVTATTRVRIEIMSKISMRLNESKVESYCITFEPRPILRVKHEKLGWKSFHFVEAIEKFSHLLKKDDLSAAYSKASIIREPIEQIFIIMNGKEARGAGGIRMSWKGKGAPTGANAVVIPESVTKS